MSTRPTIECKLNGPYLVRDLVQLRTSTGHELPTQPTLALCRCGGSANKPFCDGTHQKNGFSSAGPVADATAASPQRVAYRAPGITIYDDRTLCAHAGHCTDGLAAVFKYGSEPWIDAGGAPPTAIVETVRRCPSGALSCTVDGPAVPELAASPVLTVTKNGPNAVLGDVALKDAQSGRSSPAPRYTLCRCGGSKNKPFCDGTHWSIGFADERN